MTVAYCYARHSAYDTGPRADRFGFTPQQQYSFCRSRRPAFDWRGCYADQLEHRDIQWSCRPMAMELFKQLKRGDTVVCQMLIHLTRPSKDEVRRQLSIFDNMGIRLVCLHRPLFDSLRYTSDQLEKIVKRAKKQFDTETLRLGEWYCPVGWKRSEHDTLIPDIEQRKSILELVAMRQSGMSFTAISVRNRQLHGNSKAPSPVVVAKYVKLAEQGFPLPSGTRRDVPLGEIEYKLKHFGALTQLEKYFQLHGNSWADCRTLAEAIGVEYVTVKCLVYNTHPECFERRKVASNRTQFRWNEEKGAGQPSRS